MSSVRIPPGGIIDLGQVRQLKQQAAEVVQPINVQINLLLAGDKATIERDLKNLKAVLDTLQGIAQQGSQKLNEINTTKSDA